VKDFKPAMICLIWIELGCLLFLGATITGRNPAQSFQIATSVLLFAAIWSAVRSHNRAMTKPGKGKSQLWLDPDF
jgi:hypothetical protein